MNNLTALQRELLSMFSTFHRYCVENDLSYYALGGTMLGALRHNGFIPWDDDIDVGMPRKDYDRLSSLLENKKIDERYVLETPQSNDINYYYPFSKLYDTKTTVIENTNNRLVRGIFIDIFPLDGLGKTIEESRLNYNLIERKINFLDLMRVKASSDRPFVKNIALILLHCLPESLVSKKKICLKIVDLCKKHDFENEIYGGNLVGAWGFKEVMQREVFGIPKLYKFENIEIYGAEDADKYLTNQYGDWRKLPPVEKRITHHDYYLDLEHGYMDS